jgi:hypothetical protein
MKPYRIAVPLGVVAAWAAVTRSWIAPGLAAIATGQVILARLHTRASPPDPRSVLAFLALSLFGVAYLTATLVGSPATSKFWIALASALAILVPIVLLARRLFHGSTDAARDRST